MIAALMIVAVIPLCSQNVVVESRLDSVEMYVGSQAMLTVETTVDSGAELVFPDYRDTVVAGLEVIDCLKPDTQRLAESLTAALKKTAFCSAKGRLSSCNMRPSALQKAAYCRNGHDRIARRGRNMFKIVLFKGFLIRSSSSLCCRRRRCQALSPSRCAAMSCPLTARNHGGTGTICPCTQRLNGVLSIPPQAQVLLPCM